MHGVNLKFGDSRYQAAVVPRAAQACIPASSLFRLPAPGPSRVPASASRNGQGDCTAHLKAASLGLGPG